jgi:Type II site-specific deoxyribonuclease
MLRPGLDELAQLNQIASQLSPTRIALLNRMAASLQMAFDSQLNPNSDIATPLFSEYFASRLLIHHAVVEEKLNKKSFEYIFRDALRHDGKTAVITASDVSPGADIVVDGTRISLKTEASKDIRDRKITISKLMEARWIRDQDASELAQHAGDRLREHLAGYDRIVMLRAFKLTQGQVNYHLVEIPHDLLALAVGLQPGDIKLNPGRNGGGSVVLRDQGLDVFTLRLDGSVEKVTVTNLLVDRCISHGVWNILLGHHL